MKLSATTANANIQAQPHKAISQANSKAAASKTFWGSVMLRFWAYTDVAGKAETKSFEGLL